MRRGRQAGLRLRSGPSRDGRVEASGAIRLRAHPRSRSGRLFEGVPGRQKQRKPDERRKPKAKRRRRRRRRARLSSRSIPMAIRQRPHPHWPARRARRVALAPTRAKAVGQDRSTGRDAGVPRGAAPSARGARADDRRRKAMPRPPGRPTRIVVTSQATWLAPVRAEFAPKGVAATSGPRRSRA